MDCRGFWNTSLVILFALTLAWGYTQLRSGTPRDTAPAFVPPAIVVTHPQSVLEMEAGPVAISQGAAEVTFRVDRTNVSHASLDVTYTIQGPRCCTDGVHLRLTRPDGGVEERDTTASGMASLASYSQGFLVYDATRAPTPKDSHYDVPDAATALRMDAERHTERASSGEWVVGLSLDPPPAEGQGEVRATLVLTYWTGALQGETPTAYPQPT